jgi:hypothetical protein
VKGDHLTPNACRSPCTHLRDQCRWFCKAAWFFVPDSEPLRSRGRTLDGKSLWRHWCGTETLTGNLEHPLTRLVDGENLRRRLGSCGNFNIQWFGLKQAPCPMLPMLRRPRSPPPCLCDSDMGPNCVSPRHWPESAEGNFLTQACMYHFAAVIRVSFLSLPRLFFVSPSHICKDSHRVDGGFIRDSCHLVPLCVLITRI